MKREIISTENAPKAVGPYSQAVRVGSFVHTAGQIGLDPETGSLVEGGISVQTEQVMNNLQAVLEAAGTGFENVVKTTIYLRYINDFGTVNEVYGSYFNEEKPARSTFAVSALPLSALVEIDMVAMVPQVEMIEAPSEENPAKKKGKKKKGKRK